jgi:hypothetical protein
MAGLGIPGGCAGAREGCHGDQEDEEEGSSVAFHAAKIHPISMGCRVKFFKKRRGNALCCYFSGKNFLCGSSPSSADIFS